VLSCDERRFESLLLALRTTAGVPVDTLDRERVGHLVEVEGARATLNREGRMLADAVALHLRVDGPARSNDTLRGESASSMP
jgi:hypothetical protein